MPTGGISLANLDAYLAFDPVVACGGSWIASQSPLNEGQCDQIRDNAAAAVAAISGSVREERGSLMARAKEAHRSGR
jgi:2-dehydro-3-deoxyphosphogluconate aldolase/(4S)-4-hydroxy-2-oxoglutarate aldolase